MRFSLIDRITDLEKGKSISAVKNLSLAEEYLQDHFPGYPVMPGVLMVESLIQAGAWLMRYSEDFAYSTVMLKQARAVKFNNFVIPGRSLRVQLDIQKWEDAVCTFKATSHTDDGTAVSARLTLERFNIAEKNPELADTDAKLISYWKDLFQQIYR